MADLEQKERSTTVAITGEDELHCADVTTGNDLEVADVPDSGTSTTLALTTTVVELKVGASPLVNRKYIEMQALTAKVKWGYDVSCPFDLFKNQFFSLPAGSDCTVYLKMDSGTGSVAIAEKGKAE